MFYNICYNYMIFLIFSCIGYIVEVIFCWIEEKKLILSRGFLIGPYIPIYGVGSVLIITLLNKYYNDPLAFFCLTVILCSIIEYFTSLIMEKIFKVRWWDYSDKRFNINGRICLSNSVLFGFGGMIILYLIMPHIHNMFINMPNIIFYIITIICFLIFITDLIVTTSILFNVKNILLTYKEKDITEIAKKQIIESISKHTFNFSRIFKAFPKIGYNSEDKLEDLGKLVINTANNIKRRKKEKTKQKNRLH